MMAEGAHDIPGGQGAPRPHDADAPQPQDDSLLSQLGADSGALPVSFERHLPSEPPPQDAPAPPALPPEPDPPVISSAESEPTPPDPAPLAHPVRAITGDDVKGPPTIIDVPIRPPGLFRAIVSYLIFIAAMIGAVVLIVLFAGAFLPSSSFGSFGFSLALIFVVSFVLGIFPWIQRRRARSRGRRILEADAFGPPQMLVENFMRSRPWLSGAAGVIEMAEILGSIGRTNIVFRMAGKKNIWPIRPAAWPFEPRPLDESDPTFLELADAISAEGGAEGFEFSTADELPFRRVRRNIYMKGGYFSLCLILFFFCREVYDFYVSGRPDIWLALFTFLLYNKLFGNPTGGYGSIIWYLIPSGLLLDLRKANDDGDFRVYDRRQSNLVVYQSSTRTWAIAVSNDEMRFDTMATSREVELLLRTWASEVETTQPEFLAAFLDVEAEVDSDDAGEDGIAPSG